METNRSAHGRKTGECPRVLDPNDTEAPSADSHDEGPLLTSSNSPVDPDPTSSAQSSSQPVTPECKKRPGEKGQKKTVGSLRLSLEKKMGTVEKMLESHVERIWEENVEKHPWLMPIETWIADRCKSSTSSYTLHDAKRRESGDTVEGVHCTVEQTLTDAAVDADMSRSDVTDHDAARLSNATRCHADAGQTLPADEDADTEGPEEKLREMLRVIRDAEMNERSERTRELLRTLHTEARETTRSSPSDSDEVRGETQGRSQEESESVGVRADEPTYDFKYTSPREDEEPRLESRVMEHLRNLRRGSPAKPERHGFDPAMLISRIRERRENAKARECEEQVADGGVLEVKEARHHNHDLLDKLKDNVKGKMEDIHRYFQRTNRLADVNRRLKSQIWSSVVTIVLVEAKNLLPMDIDGLSDPYVKFRLGTEKYKSKVANKTLNPVWLEQFDLHLYEDPYLGQELEVTVWDRDKSHQDDLMGRTLIDLATLERETTHRLWRELEDGSGNIFLLLTISGTTASETISDLAAHEETPRERVQLLQRYCIMNTLHRPRDVGHLTVKVYRAQGLAAADLGGKSDPFCVLELVNSRLQTQTEYKTLAPNWQKIFTFNVKDINSVLEVTVYDEDRDHKVEFLGRVAIPLLRIRNGEKRWYALKDKKLRGRAKGNSPQILLELTVIWNIIRACIRTLNPKEKKYMEPEIKFKRQVFLRNVLRLKSIIIIFIDLGKYIQSCFEWESKMRSAVALVIFVLGCYYFEPYMIPSIALLILLKYYLVAVVTGAPISSLSSHLADSTDIGADDCPPTPGDDDDDEDDKDKEEKKSLKERLQVIQEVTQTVQNSIGYIASLCERVKNLFNFTVPYLSYLAMLLTILGAFVLYFVPVRYLILAWGVNKFSRKVVRPHSVPNNEILDLISRVPDDEELLNYRELKPLPTADCERGGTASTSAANTRREQRKRQKAA